MNKKYDVVIVGGGASGLMCANTITLDGKKVLIVDKNSLGKKILSTGNGRCNFTNKDVQNKYYNTSLTNQIIKDFDQNKTIEFFKSIGIESYCDEEGRFYPVSDTAKDIKDALVSGLKGIDILISEVIKITKKEDLFKISFLEGEDVYSKKVVMASGNKDIETILKEFNLPFEDRKYILTGFEIKKDFDKSLFGVREDCILRCKKVDFEEKGQIQFRKDGISGIVVFNLSSVLQRKYNCPVEIEVELLPQYSNEKLKECIIYKSKNCKNLLIKDVFLGLLKPEMSKYILKRAGIINIERSISGLLSEEIDILVKTCKKLNFICERLFEDSQVISGGIDLKNLNSLESCIKGLYFCGEATNVFGVCGGYNLQWAWSSGYFIGKKL